MKNLCLEVPTTFVTATEVPSPLISVPSTSQSGSLRSFLYCAWYFFPTSVFQVKPNFPSAILRELSLNGPAGPITVIVNDFSSLSGGVPLSETRMVNEKTPGFWARLVAHENTPFVELIIAPSDAPAGRL